MLRMHRTAQRLFQAQPEAQTEREHIVSAKRLAVPADFFQHEQHLADTQAHAQQCYKATLLPKVLHNGARTVRATAGFRRFTDKPISVL